MTSPTGPKWEAFDFEADDDEARETFWCKHCNVKLHDLVSVHTCEGCCRTKMEHNDTGKKSHRKATNHPMFQSESSKSSIAKFDQSEMSMSTILNQISGLKSEIAMAVSAKKYLKAHHLGKELNALKKVIGSMRGNESKINEKSVKSKAKDSMKQGDSLKRKEKIKTSSTMKMEQSLKEKRKVADKNKLLSILKRPISTVSDTVGSHLNINTFSVKAANKKVENKSKVRTCTITSQSESNFELPKEHEREMSNNSKNNATSTAMAKEIGSMVNNNVSKKLVKGPNIALKSKKDDLITPRGYNYLDKHRSPFLSIGISSLTESSLKIEDSSDLQQFGVMFNKETKAFSPRLDKKSNENDSTGSTSNCTANEEKLYQLKLKLSRPNVQNEIFGGFAPSSRAIPNFSQEWNISHDLQNDSEPLSTCLYNQLDETRYTKLDVL